MTANPTTSTAGELPPHDIQAEAVVLGSMLLDAKAAVPKVRAVLGDNPEPFYRPAHQTLYRTILARIDRGEPLDLVLLKADLERTQELQAVGGMDYVVALVDGLPDAGNAESYAKIVREKAAKRRYLILGNQLAADAKQPGTIAAALREELQTALGDMEPDAGTVRKFKTVRELATDHPDLRPPVIHGLAREGETVNVIAPSKARKSWLVGGLALSVATGRPWLDTFQTEQGDALIVDNELHSETSAYRLPRIGDALGIPWDDYADHVIVDNVRGRMLNILGLPRYFAPVQPGRFKIIVLDAIYRFWPPDTSENDNAAIANVYNIIDSIAARLRCVFVLIHHTSKGNQSGKSLVDVGSGAGAIARAADAHVILLPHETDTRTAPAIVLDAAGRSWPPIEPACFRFNWPVWVPAPDLDPAKLKPDRPRRPKVEKAEQEDAGPKVDQTEAFAAKYIGKKPKATAAIIDAAIRDGLSENKARNLLKAAIGRELAFKWTGGPREPNKIATTEQPKLPAEEPKP